MRGAKKSPKQLQREIDQVLAKPGKHKGSRYTGMQGAAYRAGWDSAGSDMRSRTYEIIFKSLGNGVLTVAIDRFLEGDIERGLEIANMSGGFGASLENEAFRSSGLDSTEKLKIYKDPDLIKKLVRQFEQTDGSKWKDGYADRVLDELEKRVGMREPG